jgi:predicted phosphohydrolase
MIHYRADLHLGGIGLREPLPHPSPEDWLMVAGDLTDSGTEAQYREALHLLSPWRGRICMCPGNHDLGWKGLLVQGPCERRWSTLCLALGAQRLTRLPGRLVVSLDSTRHTWSPLDLARGSVGIWQRGRLRRQWGPLARSEGRILTILQHHSPWCDDPSLVLDDAESELMCLRAMAHEGVRLELVCGHVHPGGEERAEV